MSNNSQSPLTENETSKESEFLTQAENLAEKKQWADVIKSYQEALKINPDNARAYQGLGDGMMAQEKWEDAIAAYQEAIAREPDLFTAYHKQGDALIKLHIWEEAEATFKKALELRPNFHWLHYQLGEALAGQKRWEEAKETYGRCLEIKADFLYGHQKLGKCLLELHQWEEAHGRFERAIALEADYHWAHYSLGEALVGQKDWEGAVSAFERAIDIKPDLMFAHQKLGDALLKLEKYPEAVRAYKKVIDLNPDFAWGHYQLALALLESGSFEEAVVSYQNALKLNSGLYGNVSKLDKALEKQVQPIVKSALKQYHQEITKHPENINNYYKALEIEPNNAQLQLELAKLLEAKGDTEKAAIHYQKVSEINPQLLPVNSGKITLEKYQSNNKLNALQESRENTTALQPEISETLLEKGDKYRQKGQLDKALDCYRQAIMLNSSLPPITLPKKRPTFSVVMPIYDRTQMLHESLLSLSNQTYQDFEIILVLDGSPIETRNVVQNFQYDSRFRIYSYSEASGNACRGRNRGIIEAKGNYIALMDSDDIALPERLEVTLKKFEESNCDAVVGKARYLVDSARQESPVKSLSENEVINLIYPVLKRVNPIVTSTISIRRDVLLKYGGFRPEMRYREDHELWLRLLYRGCKMIYIDRLFAVYRLHTTNNELNFKKNDTHWAQIMHEYYHQPFQNWGV